MNKQQKLIAKLKEQNAVQTQIIRETTIYIVKNLPDHDYHLNVSSTESEFLLTFEPMPGDQIMYVLPAKLHSNILVNPENGSQVLFDGSAEITTVSYKPKSKQKEVYLTVTDLAKLYNEHLDRARCKWSYAPVRVDITDSKGIDYPAPLEIRFDVTAGEWGEWKVVAN